MSIKHLHEYRDPELSRKIIEQITKTSQKKIRLMEVCGTHTTSIFRNGIRSLLPKTISLLSGPNKLAKPYRLAAFKLICLQGIVALIAAVIVFVGWGVNAGQSALAGGAVALLPNFVFVVYAFRYMAQTFCVIGGGTSACCDCKSTRYKTSASSCR